MNLKIASYQEQKQNWPQSGRHIMAQFDDESIIVYQAYKPSIGHFAAKHGRFGGEFKFSRMSWVKPNFLWMMYRSGWGTKVDQEVTLAIRLKRPFFDTLLKLAVHSSFDSARYASREAWQTAVSQSDVRLQWDPDHNPLGGKEERRAIQLGLRGAVLQGFKGDGLLAIEDISGFVEEQRQFLNRPDYEGLMTPKEAIYPVFDSETKHKLGVLD